VSEFVEIMEVSSDVIDVSITHKDMEFMERLEEHNKKP